jgi:acetate kinase
LRALPEEVSPHEGERKALSAFRQGGVMPAAILVLNSGSSSLKFAVIEPQSGQVMTEGGAERLQWPGQGQGQGDEATFQFKAEPGQRLPAGAGHAEALDHLLDALPTHLAGKRLAAVGHRVVHGGELFSDSVVLDAGVIRQIRACSELAPLHNPANLLGIDAARSRFSELPQVAVFDTAFHQTLPPRAYTYAIPYELYERHKVRRYGFHGTSHRYVATEAARRLGRRPDTLHLVTAHLGNGASACAVKDGRSVDTTMGLTPLEGLVMGTRSGDVDANLHQFLADRAGLDLRQITELLNRKSGLLGLSGASNDMRTLIEMAGHGHARARLAIDVFCYRLARAILALCAPLDRLDALIFTGGIGEHAAPVRADTLGQLRVLGAEVDTGLNDAHGAPGTGRITTESSRLLALVVPTNEELVIARETARLVCASAT